MTLHNNLLINMNLKRDFRFQGVSKIRLNTLTCTGDAKGSLAQAGIPKGLPCKPELQGVGQPAGAQVFRLVGHHVAFEYKFRTGISPATWVVWGRRPPGGEVDPIA
eukprot:scaffold27426_cov19-Tisochrysis_lutea.AAC.5